MKQTQQNDFTENKADKTPGEPGAYTFFALLCFLVAIIFLSIFLGHPLNGFSSMLVLLGVIVFGFSGVYLLGHRPASESEDEDDFALENSQDEEDMEDGVIEGTLVESVQDEDEDDEIVDEDDRESLGEDEEDGEEWEDEGDEEEEYDEVEEVEDDNDNEDEDDENDEQTLNAFKLLVEEALDSIPFEFRKRMENLAVMVEKEPDREVLQRVGTREGYTLLGLYEGTPLTAQSYQGMMLPERITIYQRTIEAYCHGNPDRMRQQVRATLLHEVAHHFGLDHDEMPIWVK